MTDSDTDHGTIAEFERRVAIYISRHGPIPLAEVGRFVGRSEEECRQKIGLSSRLRIGSDNIVTTVLNTGSFAAGLSAVGSATGGGIDDLRRFLGVAIEEGTKKKHRRPGYKALMGGDDEGGQGKVGYLCIADEFNLEEIKLYYAKQGYHAKVAYDVLHVKPLDSSVSPVNSGLPGGYGATALRSAGTAGPQGAFQMFIFNYGVVVWWGYDQRQYNMVETDFVMSSSKIGKWFVNRYKATIIAANFPQWSNFSADWRESALGHTTEPDELFVNKMDYDHFYIPGDREDVKLCISHALAQSAKIDYLEIKIAELTQSCKPLPRELKETGSVTISERKLLQLRGEVLFYRLMLKSGSDLLDEPELFWQHPWLKPFYTSTKEFFAINTRVETLDAKLDAANQILEMIMEQFHQRHGSRLEWIVIWLVMVEVIIGILELILDVKPWLTYHSPLPAAVGAPPPRGLIGAA